MTANQIIDQPAYKRFVLLGNDGRETAVDVVPGSVAFATHAQYVSAEEAEDFARFVKLFAMLATSMEEQRAGGMMPV